MLDEERREGQRFLFDVELEVGETAAASDRIEDAVDYRDVAAAVREVSDGRRYRLLEALAAAVADALLERFPVTWVRVRVRKPDVRLEPPVASRPVTVERQRGMTTAYVGLGANLGDREATIRRGAARCSARSPVSDVAAVSTLRDTEPGRHARPAAVPERRRARSRPSSSPRELLDALLARRARARPGCATSAAGRGRSTSTCSSTATSGSTSRA